MNQPYVAIFAPGDGHGNTIDVAEVSVILTVVSSSGKVFRVPLMNGLGAGGPFFANPIGDRPDRDRSIVVCERRLIVPRRRQILVPCVVS